jgi:hypothetical protein
MNMGEDMWTFVECLRAEEEAGGGYTALGPFRRDVVVSVSTGLRQWIAMDNCQ